MKDGVIQSALSDPEHRLSKTRIYARPGIMQEANSLGRLSAISGHQALQREGQPDALHDRRRQALAQFTHHVDGPLKHPLRFVQLLPLLVGAAALTRGVEMKARRRQQLADFVVQDAADARGFLVARFDHLDNDRG